MSQGVVIVRVNVRPGFHKRPDNLDGIASGGPLQRRPTLMSLHIDIGPRFKQDFDNLKRRVIRSINQRRPIKLVLRVHICPGFQKGIEDFRPGIIFRSFYQSRLPIRAVASPYQGIVQFRLVIFIFQRVKDIVPRRIHLRPRVKEGLHDLNGIAQDGSQQRRVIVSVPRVDIGSGFNEQLDNLWICVV